MRAPRSREGGPWRRAATLGHRAVALRVALATVCLTAVAASAQAPTSTPAPAPVVSPVAGIRNKISAGDLLSAESILDAHREQHGEDGGYLVGLSWLARGALVLGDLTRAEQAARATRARCSLRRAAGADFRTDRDLETAFGASVEVQAQLVERRRGRAAAAALVRAALDSVPGPVALRSRLMKRLDMLTLAGSPAPELIVEERLGAPFEPLASLRGASVLLFGFAEWCGDCKAQAATLARVRARYAAQGLRIVALTRFYDADSVRSTERARVDSVWKAVYPGLSDVPVVISTASMERYGVSATPTYVFIDRRGIVRRYAPTRLTDAEFDRALDERAR